MNSVSRLKSEEFRGIGEEMYRMIVELYPICRSITGNGYRQTMRRIQETIPISIQEVPSGTEVFDWTVPKEWNIRDAYVKGPSGKKLIDFREHNLHVMQYSVPVHLKMSLHELKHHLYALPDHPEWIPYRTSYYKDDWGFCLSQKQLDGLEEGEYEVVIDASLEEGHLTYGEYYLPGEVDNEVLFSCHCCHPSLCNDNLSGIAVASMLAKLLTGASLRYSYRFLFIPGAIGSITWLWKNEEVTSRIQHGLVVSGVGDSGRFHYKKSRRGNAEIDRVVQYVLKHSGHPYQVRDFSPYGYDERQYCSPGFNLSVGSLTRSPYGSYTQYHTSADNLEFVSAGALAESLSIYLKVIRVLENNRRYLNLNPKCEVRLGKRGLYRSVGGGINQPMNELALLWVLNLSDGNHSVLDIGERSGLPFDDIEAAVGALVGKGLLEPVVSSTPKDGGDV